MTLILLSLAALLLTAVAIADDIVATSANVSLNLTHHF